MSVSLTGNRRYRVAAGGWFRSPTVVLQVEVAGYSTDYLGGYIDHYPVRYWRDAEIVDLTRHEAQVAAAVGVK